MIDTTFLNRCIATLDKAFGLFQQTSAETIDHDMYRSACIKEFEIILEQCGKLLRKVLKPYFHSSAAVDQLVFKDLFRHAALRKIITNEEVERWLIYRDNRNNTADDYGVNFAEEALALLPAFIEDAKNLVAAIENQNKP